MKTEYKELPEEYNEIFKNAWSVENMAAHDAGGRTLGKKVRTDSLTPAAILQRGTI